MPMPCPISAPISARLVSAVCARVASVNCIGEAIKRPRYYLDRVDNPRDQGVLLYHFWEWACMCEGENQLPHFACAHMRAHKNNYCDAPCLVKVMLGESVLWSGGLDDEEQMLSEYCRTYNRSEREMRFIGVVNQSFEGPSLCTNYP